MTNLKRNDGSDFDIFQLLCYSCNSSSINLPSIEQSVSNLCNRKGSCKDGQIASLLRAVTCLDLTTLSGDDTNSNVERLCHKAVNPIHDTILDSFGMNSKDIHVGAVCVYPAQIRTAVKTLERLQSKIPVAAVAAGFPSGQYHMNTRIDEIYNCVSDGATEIDIVINRSLVLQGEWKKLYEEVQGMKDACGEKAALKTIISAGELGSLDNVYRASVICMAAGADFIKTSTGKETVNATLPIAMTMTRAITDYFNETGYEVGFKPAGGIRTSKDVYFYQSLMRNELGSKWLYSDLFRIGASSLLADIEQNLYSYAFNSSPRKCYFPFQ